MKSKNCALHLAALLTVISSTPAGAVILGPSFPPDGGSVTFTATGGPPGSVGGRNLNYSSFTLAPASVTTYWGPSSASLPQASLDGSPDALTFSFYSGTIAIWSGTTSWTNPMNLAFYASVPVELRISVTGLGANPWVTSGSVAGLDPGPGTGIGAVVDTLGGTNYTANLQFLAKDPTTLAYTAINSFQQSTGGLTTSSFSGGFYSLTVVPEPGAYGLALAGMSVVGLAMVRRRRT